MLFGYLFLRKEYTVRQIVSNCSRTDWFSPSLSLIVIHCYCDHRCHTRNAFKTTLELQGHCGFGPSDPRRITSICYGHCDAHYLTVLYRAAWFTSGENISKVRAMLERGCVLYCGYPNPGYIFVEPAKSFLAEIARIIITNVHVFRIGYHPRIGKPFPFHFAILSNSFIHNTRWEPSLPVNLCFRRESFIFGELWSIWLTFGQFWIFSLQQVSSVSTHIVLTARKAISLCFSVWWFGNGWNAKLAVGAAMVFLGSILYTTGTKKAKQH